MPLFIGNTHAPGHQSPPGWIWLKPVDGGLEIYSFVDGAWIKQVELSFMEHSHPTHGDINFTGVVAADGSVGLTGERTVGGYKFTFKKGLLTGFEQV